MYMYPTVTLHYHPIGRRDSGRPSQKKSWNRLKGLNLGRGRRRTSGRTKL
jgi:hypothetical protein